MSSTKKLCLAVQDERMVSRLLVSVLHYQSQVCMAGLHGMNWVSQSASFPELEL